MKAKEFIPASKPRNPVVRQQQTSGAGAHRDKKKEQKQGHEKHKNKKMDEGVEDYADLYSPEAVKLAKKFVDHYDITDDSDIQLTVEIIDLYLEDFKEKNQPVDLKFIKSKLASSFRQVYRGMGGGPSFKKSFKEQGMEERVRDSEDWDEGNTEPGNNFAIYINGKKWKVFSGPYGAYADSPEERREFNRLKDMAAKKSAATGKKWEVYITGEKATESVEEGWSDAYVAQRTGRPRTPYSVYIKGKKWKDFANDDHARAVMDKLKAKFKADGRDPETITIAPSDLYTNEASSLEKFRQASNERAKKHADAEKEMNARHSSGKEDMKGAIDRLEKQLNNK
jgi:hypothetical protein